MKNTTDLYYAIWKDFTKYDKKAIICLENMNNKKFSEFDDKQFAAMYGVQEFLLLQALSKVRQRHEYYKSKVEESK